MAFTMSDTSTPYGEPEPDESEYGSYGSLHALAYGRRHNG